MTEMEIRETIEDVLIEAKANGVVVRNIVGYDVHFIPRAGGFFYIYDGPDPIYMNESGNKIAYRLFQIQDNKKFTPNRKLTLGNY